MSNIETNLYDDVTIISTQRPRVQRITIKDLKTILPLDEQRQVNTTKMKQKLKKSGGFSTAFAKPLLISDIKGLGQFQDYRITDGGHTAHSYVHMFPDHFEIDAIVYDHKPEEAAKAFALWNKEGVQLLSSEQVFPAQVRYGDGEAYNTYMLLNMTGRKFKGILPTHHTVGHLASNQRIIARGKLEEAIKINFSACKFTLDLVDKLWPVPADGKDIVDSVLLVLGWTYLFNKVTEITHEPLPFIAFKDWICQKQFTDRPDQEDWIYSGRRAAQREKQDIARFTLEDFLADASTKLTDKMVEVLSQKLVELNAK
jgi:hypothetical protein